MLSPLIQLDIKSDSEVIDTFNSYDNLTIPNEVFYIRGTIELTLQKPLDIRELYIQFRGTVESVISIADFYYNNEVSNTYGDEIPINKWNTMDSSEITFMESISRKALGQANSILPIVDERVFIINKHRTLPEGKSSLPFTIKINNAHRLPPSILLPHHIIKYTLSAKVKLNSFNEWVKVKYYNTRINNKFSKMKNSNKDSNRNNEANNIASSRSMESILSSSTALLTPPLSPTHTNETTESSSDTSTTDVITAAPSPTPPHYNNTDLISAKLAKNNKLMVTNKRQYIGMDQIIQIYRHSYPSMTSLDTIPRFRFRGARKDRVKYEVGMAKFTCLQSKSFTFKCMFDSLCSDAEIASLDYYLEQTETYPIRAGDYCTKLRILPGEIVPRYRKFSRNKYDMRNYENGTELELSISLDLPQISPRIETPTLNISHKLRLIVRFEDENKERKMSLSFPMSVGTVPRLAVSNHYVSSSLRQDEERINFDAVHVRQELDQWLLTPDTALHAHQQQQHHLDKLPSYTDVLQEGNPPSPFLDR